MFLQNASIHYWLSTGVPSEKLVLGMATYGRSFRIDSSANSLPGSPFNGQGDIGPYSGTAGFLAYYEVSLLYLAQNL